MHSGSTAASPVAFRSVEALFRPASIALVGASESAAGGWSKGIFNNISLRRARRARSIRSIRGATRFGASAAIRRSPRCPDPVDLALVITPAATIPATLREGVDARPAKRRSIYAAGFGEGGDAEGIARAAELADARRGRPAHLRAELHGHALARRASVSVSGRRACATCSRAKSGSSCRAAASFSIGRSMRRRAGSG